MCWSVVTRSLRVCHQHRGVTANITLVETCVTDRALANAPSLLGPYSEWWIRPVRQRTFVQGTDWIAAIPAVQRPVTKSSVDSTTSKGASGMPNGVVTDPVFSAGTGEKSNASGSITPRFIPGRLTSHLGVGSKLGER
jgi:hypothetical protein